VVALRDRDFITATRALGAGTRYTLVRHILPQLVPTIIVWGTLGIATNVMLEASLSYLGIGVQPPDPSWGKMVAEGAANQGAGGFAYPWLLLFPGAAVFLTVLAFNLLGDGLRDALDPRGGLNRR
jgi:peptide/nickel transport system permease protein